MKLPRRIPRFNIRQLLWFTALAGLGCWWWLPSRDDAVVIENTPLLRFGSPPLRYGSAAEWERRREAEILSYFRVPENIDWQHRDLWIAPARLNIDSIFFVPANGRNRWQGRLLWIVADDAPHYDTVFAISKRTHVFFVSARQAAGIDAAAASALFAMGLGGAWLLRHRVAKAP